SDSLPAVADTLRNEAGRCASTSGTIHGVVSLEPSGAPVGNAVVTIAELQRSVLTDENGAFQFTDVPAGRYQVIAHLDRVPNVVSVPVRDARSFAALMATECWCCKMVCVSAASLRNRLTK